MHTKEPWSEDAEIILCDGSIAIKGADGEVICYASPQNSRRIVACIKACRPLATESLERYGLAGIMSSTELILREQCEAAMDERIAAGKRIEELERQRNELLASLEAARKNEARYLHLRNGGNSDYRICCYQVSSLGFVQITGRPEYIDRIIDAAIDQTPSTPLPAGIGVPTTAEFVKVKVERDELLAALEKARDKISTIVHLDGTNRRIDDLASELNAAIAKVTQS